MARKSTPATPNQSTLPKVSRKTLLEEHRSLKALKSEARPGETLEDVMRRKCRAMVSHAKSYRWSGPPFCPLEFASIHDIRVEETDENIDGDGCIFPRRGDVVIQYKSGRPEERQRFTICHELAHTCFSDAFEFVRKQGDGTADDPAHKKFENLCDVGAAELLMPHEEFSTDLGESEMNLMHMDRLRVRYVASVEATLKRMVDFTDHPCAAVFLTDESFKDFSAIRGQMRVQWMWKSKSFTGYIPQGTLAPRNSDILQSALETARPFSKTRDTWWISSKPRSWYMEAVRLPVIPGLFGYAKVAALLHARIP